MAIILSILFYSAQNISIKFFNKHYIKNRAGFLLFQFMLCLCVGILFVFSGADVSKCGTASLILGTLFGIFFILNIYFYTKLMRFASLSVSVLFNAFGMLIPTLTGIIFWREKIRFNQLLGLLLLCASLFLVANVSKKDRITKNNKMIYYGLLTLLFGGLSGSLQSTQQKILKGNEIKEFSVICFMTAALLLLPVLLIKLPEIKQEIHSIFKFKPLSVIISAGIGTFLGALTLMKALCTIPSHIVYPVANGGIILVVLLISATVFHEKQSIKEKSGILLGIAAIVLLSI